MNYRLLTILPVLFIFALLAAPPAPAGDSYGKAPMTFAEPATSSLWEVDIVPYGWLASSYAS